MKEKFEKKINSFMKNNNLIFVDSEKFETHLSMINEKRKDYYCPCSFGEVKENLCPKPDCLKTIQENGICHCKHICTKDYYMVNYLESKITDYVIEVFDMLGVVKVSEFTTEQIRDDLIKYLIGVISDSIDSNLSIEYKFYLPKLVIEKHNHKHNFIDRLNYVHIDIDSSPFFKGTRDIEITFFIGQERDDKDIYYSKISKTMSINWEI